MELFVVITLLLETAGIIILCTLAGSCCDVDIKNMGDYRHDLGSSIGFFLGISLAIVNAYLALVS